MNYLILFFALIPSIVQAYIYNKKRYTYRPGVICNYDIYPTITEQVAVRYYCVPKSQCLVVRARNPAISQHINDTCGDYLTPVSSDDPVVCCHSSDIDEKYAVEWKRNAVYVPGLRSYLMCREHAKSLCISNSESYCNRESQGMPEPIEGLPRAIDKYPHTALVGYKSNYTWKWNCLGSIISKRYVITAGWCGQKINDQDLFVKLGESFICDTCPDNPEEQVIRVKTITSKHTENRYYMDFAILQLSKDIWFNRVVRPACLFNDYSAKQSFGWFTRYGKPRREIKIPLTDQPVFYAISSLTTRNNFFTFRVKGGEDVIISFGFVEPIYQREKNVEVVLGAEGNTYTYIIIYNDKHDQYTPNITVSLHEYRGFWIQLEDNFIAVGQEDVKKPFMTRPLATKAFTMVGLGSAKSETDWIVSDHYTLFALHDIKMEVLYRDRCQPYVNGNHNLDTGGLIDAIMFCARNVKGEREPCDEDWGGTIQMMDDKHYCMWQIFGVFAKDDVQGNCFKRKGPSVFNSITPVLEWIENIVFREFAIENVTVDEPECTLEDTYRININRC